MTNETEQLPTAMQLGVGTATVIDLFKGINPIDLSEYLVDVGKGLQDFSADGVEHIAMMLGIGITRQEVTEFDDYWMVQSTAKGVIDGRESVATVTEPKVKGGYKNPFALETACRRANRNALKYAFPSEQLKRKLKEAIIAGKAAKQSRISSIQDMCGNAYIENADALGKPKADLLQQAEASWGADNGNWSVEQWEMFLEALGNPETFGDLIGDTNGD